CARTQLERRRNPVKSRAARIRTLLSMRLYQPSDCFGYTAPSSPANEDAVARLLYERPPSVGRQLLVTLFPRNPVAASWVEMRGDVAAGAASPQSDRRGAACYSIAQKPRARNSWRGRRVITTEFFSFVRP